MGLGYSRSGATEKCAQERSRSGEFQQHQDGAAPDSGGTTQKRLTAAKGTCRALVNSPRGWPPYTISGATKVIRSVMHPAWSKRPPLVKHIKKYLERFIEISFRRKPTRRPVQRRVVRIPIELIAQQERGREFQDGNLHAAGKDAKHQRAAAQHDQSGRTIPLSFHSKILFVMKPR